MSTTLPSPLRIGVARTGLEVKQFFRAGAAVVFTFLFPIILLFIFASAFDGQDFFDGALNAATYFTPGMIASGIFLSSFQSLAISIAIERDDSTLKRLRGTPMAPVSYFLGKIGLVLVTSVIQLGVMLGISALLLGVDLPSEGFKWVRLIWIFALGAAAGSALGIAYSIVPKSGRAAAAVVTPVVLVLQFISGVFFVYNDLPSWMRTVAEVFPLKWLAQGMRSVFLPEDLVKLEVSGSWQLGTCAVVLAVWLVVGLIGCQRFFRWVRSEEG